MINDRSIGMNSDNADAKLLLCALVLGNARNKTQTPFEKTGRISEAKALQDAIFHIYNEMRDGFQSNFT